MDQDSIEHVTLPNFYLHPLFTPPTSIQGRPADPGPGHVHEDVYEAAAGQLASLPRRCESCVPEVIAALLTKCITSLFLKIVDLRHTSAP